MQSASACVALHRGSSAHVAVFSTVALLFLFPPYDMQHDLQCRSLTNDWSLSCEATDGLGFGDEVITTISALGIFALRTVAGIC